MADLLKLTPFSYVVVLGAFFINLATGILEPTIAPYLEVLGESKQRIGFIYSLRWLLVAILSIPFAIIASKVGNMKVISISIFSATIGSLVLVFVPGSEGVMGFYILIGLAASASSGPGAAVLAENKGTLRVAAFGLYATTWMIPPALGAGISAIWFQENQAYTVSNLTSIFPLTIYIMVIGTILFFLSFAKALRSQEIRAIDLAPIPVKNQFRILFAPIIFVSVSLLIAVNFLMGSGAGSSIPFLPPYLKSLGANPSELSILVLIMNLFMAIASLLAAPLAKRFGDLNVFAFTTILSVGSLLGLVFTNDLQIAAFFFISRGTFANMTAPISQSLVLTYIEPKIHALGSAVAQNIRWVGWVIFSPISGTIIDKFGYSSSFIFTSILYTIATIVFIWVNKTRPNLEELKKNHDLNMLYPVPIN